MDYEIVDIQPDSRYPFNPRANAFELAKQQKHIIPPPMTLIATVHATGNHFVYGPASSYSIHYPTELTTLIEEAEYNVFIEELNEAIRKYWPCLFSFILAYSFAIMTCFFSLYLPKMCMDDVDRFKNYVLERWNETWEVKGVKVMYRRRCLTSQLEFYRL